MCGQGIGPGGPQKLSGHTEPLSSKGGANEKGGGRKSKELSFLFYDHAEEQPRRQGMATSTD